MGHKLERLFAKIKVEQDAKGSQISFNKKLQKADTGLPAVRFTQKDKH